MEESCNSTVCIGIFALSKLVFGAGAKVFFHPSWRLVRIMVRMATNPIAVLANNMRSPSLRINCFKNVTPKSRRFFSLKREAEIGSLALNINSEAKVDNRPLAEFCTIQRMPWNHLLSKGVPLLFL